MVRRLFLGLLTAFAVLCTPITPAHADLPDGMTEARLSLDAPATAATVGVPITLTGRFEGLVNGVWTPISGYGVSVWANGPGTPETTADATTGPDGRYAAKLTLPQTDDRSVEIRAGGGIGGVPVQSEPRSLQVKPATATGAKVQLSVSYDADAIVRADAIIAAVPLGTPLPQGTASLQYSPDGWTGWKTVRTRRDSTPDFGAFYHQMSGYWRVGYAAKGIPTAYSRTVKAWRWATYFTGFKASPKKLRYGAKTTVGGRLWEYTGFDKTRPYAHRSVQLLFTCKKSGGDKKWFTDMGWTKTDGKGRFKKKVKAWCTGRVTVVFNGATGRFSSAAKPVRLTVTGSKYRSRFVPTPYQGVLPPVGRP